jgi:hypothetical protein
VGELKEEEEEEEKKRTKKNENQNLKRKKTRANDHSKKRKLACFQELGLYLSLSFFLFVERQLLCEACYAMRLAARVARSCCALQLQQQRGRTNAIASRASSTLPHPNSRARGDPTPLRRLEAMLARPLTTSCRSQSEQSSSSNRGGVAESSTNNSTNSKTANGDSDSDSDSDDQPQPLPTKNKPRRMRLDEAASLVAGPTVSRTVIQSWIARGKVLVDGVPVTKAGHSVPAKARVEVRASEERFVCRGGLKLDAALERFGVDVTGMRAIDCGLSTGGFTDRLLQGGAEAVLGVDVGYGEFWFGLGFFSLFFHTFPRCLGPLSSTDRKRRRGFAA